MLVFDSVLFLIHQEQNGEPLWSIGCRNSEEVSPANGVTQKEHLSHGVSLISTGLAKVWSYSFHAITVQVQPGLACETSETRDLC